jgi:hypothetical protein
MSVPLDNLYEWLDNSTAGDKIIYRWYPHGSKNLDQLRTVRCYDKYPGDSRIIVVCHDQEPLFWQALNNNRDFDWTYQQFQQYSQQPFPRAQWPWKPTQTLESYVRSDFPANVTAKSVLLHSEPNSAALHQIDDHWIPVMIWSHALIAQDWFRYAQHDRTLMDISHPRYDFLVYSRAWTGSREYRLWFLQQIHDSDLRHRCLVKFSAWDQQHHHSQHRFSDQTWQHQSHDMEHVFCDNTSTAQASATYSSQDLNQCAIEVVLETVIDRVHLTEKTCRALACGKPFVLIGGAGSLRWLRQWGFETFDTVLDESYDDCVDPKQRVLKVLQTMQQYCTNKTCNTALDVMRRIARRNQQRFFSAAFIQQIQQQFDTDFAKAVMEISQLGQRHHVANVFASHCGTVSRDLGIEPSQSADG